MRLSPNGHSRPILFWQSHDRHFRALRTCCGQILDGYSRPSVLDASLNTDAAQVLPSGILEFSQLHRLHLFPRRELPTRDSSLLSFCGEVAEIATPPPISFSSCFFSFLTFRPCRFAGRHPFIIGADRHALIILRDEVTDARRS